MLAQVNGQQIEYEIHGMGEPIVMVANIADSPTEWPDPIVPAFEGTGYQVITFQNLGPSSSLVRELADDLSALLTNLRLDPVRLVGYSQGAFVCQELALKHPDQVRAMTLIATLGRQTAWFRLLAQSVETAVELALPRNLLAALLLLEGYSPTLLTNESRVEVLINRLMTASSPPLDPQSGLLRRSAKASFSYDNRIEALADVRVPTLVIAFEHDLWCPPSLGREVANAIRGSEYFEIPNAGHTAAITAADQILPRIIEFFSKS